MTRAALVAALADMVDEEGWPEVLAAAGDVAKLNARDFEEDEKETASKLGDVLVCVSAWTGAPEDGLCLMLGGKQ